MLIVHRTALRRRLIRQAVLCIPRYFHQSYAFKRETQDPRIADLGKVLDDDFAVIRENYRAPKHAIILAHGLLGFDELHPVGNTLPGIQYWYGIVEALAAKGVEVITAAVPPSDRIEVRAERLAETITQKADGKAVNIIA